MSTPNPISLPVPPVRAEYEVPLAAPEAEYEQGKRLSAARRVLQAGWFYRALIAFALIAVWEITARVVNNDLLLPTFGATLQAFVQGVLSGEPKTGLQAL